MILHCIFVIPKILIFTHSNRVLKVVFCSLPLSDLPYLSVEIPQFGGSLDLSFVAPVPDATKLGSDLE